jgi:LacI family transcriptional regulator
MQVTLKDIAKQSGFSVTTVSRALAGYSDVSQQTRQQIVELALSMGYQANIVARQLRNKRTNTIGMIIPASKDSLSDEFFNQLIMHVGHMASELAYDFLISAQAADKEMDAYHRIVGGRRVDGVILARLRQEDPRLSYLKEQQIPFVVSGHYPEMPCDFAYVDIDSELGMRLLTEHLISLGHQNIGFISSPPELSFSSYRLRGYKTALEMAGLPFRPDYIAYGNLKRESGYEASQYLLEQNPQLTAIVSCNDVMALGAMMAAREAGRKVGRDIALTGFDDIPSAVYAEPPLTTIRQPLADIGRRMIEMLIQLIEAQAVTFPQILLPPEVVIRESSNFK